MASREDLIVAGLIIGGIALVGIVAWAVTKRGGSPRREFRLKRVSEPKLVLKNLETTKVIRDQEGNIVALEVHREVKRVD